MSSRWRRASRAAAAYIYVAWFGSVMVCIPSFDGAMMIRLEDADRVATLVLSGRWAHAVGDAPM